MFPWESPKAKKPKRKATKRKPPSRKALLKKYPLIGESGQSVPTVSGGGFEMNRRRH